MQSIQDDYNTQRAPLHYCGVWHGPCRSMCHIFKASLESKEERTKWVHQLVNIMATLESPNQVTS